ncbi:MAG: LytTR family transcriptional regulator DNA-binding domain-containing protein [Bacteroidales bacterium]|nr:LytTR family transcriptional regulator DNA-binding domain-containing protein [Bacteroidales bacterium]
MGKNKFLIKLNDRIVPVRIADITYFYSEQKNSYIVTRDNITYVIDDSLDTVEQILGREGFFRISRSVIISETAIESIHKLPGGRLTVSLRRGFEAYTDLTVSRARVDGFLHWLEES